MFEPAEKYQPARQAPPLSDAEFLRFVQLRDQPHQYAGANWTATLLAVNPGASKANRSAAYDKETHPQKICRYVAGARVRQHVEHFAIQWAHPKRHRSPPVRYPRSEAIRSNARSNKNKYQVPDVAIARHNCGPVAM